MKMASWIILVIFTLTGAAVHAHDWHKAWNLDEYALSQHPLTPTESAEPAAGCVPAYCLREINGLVETLSHIDRMLPDGPDGRSNKWFAAFTKTREDAVKAGKSLTTGDCLTLAESLAVIIGGFGDADSGFPLTPEYAACVPASRMVGITMNQAVRRHLETHHWKAPEADRGRLCLATLFSNPDFIAGLPHTGYAVRLRDLFLLFPTEVIRFLADPSNREPIGFQYSGWLCGSDFDNLGLQSSFPTEAPAGMKLAIADSKVISNALSSVRTAIQEASSSNVTHDSGYNHLPGKLSKIDRCCVHEIQKALALQLAENLESRGETWFSAHREVLSGLARSAKTTTPDGILEILPLLWECRAKIGRYSTPENEDSDASQMGFRNGDTLSYLANSVMIQYLEETEGSIPQKRMCQLLCGTATDSGSCQEGFEPFNLSSFDLLVLHPTAYLACIKTQSPEWLASMAETLDYEGEIAKDAYSESDIPTARSYWIKRFKDAVSRDHAKIEIARKAANDWLRKK